MKLFLAILLMFLLGCSRLNYYLEQARGQFKIIYNAKSNDEVLKLSKISQEDKEKIIHIKKCKNYFLHFFAIDNLSTYEKTSILETEAVSYLVIASPFFTIKPIEYSFPFLGKFPYIGFFSKESAIHFSLSEEKKSLQTYIRPVYAYSSLGHFSDPILSSFFVFSKVDLTELIFHELFHTIFFIKNDVEFNEQLADFFSWELTKKFFLEYHQDVERKKLVENSKNKSLLNLIIKLTKELESIYQKNSYFVSMKKNNSKVLFLSDEKYELFDQEKRLFDQIRMNFLKNNFMPQIKQKCINLKLNKKDCFPLKLNWNNATFASYLIYQEKQNKIQKIYNKKFRKNNLIDFYKLVKNDYEFYMQSDLTSSFSTYFFQKYKE